MTQQQRYHYGTGRRKTAVARVRLYPGSGQTFLVDNKPLDERFPQALHQQEIVEPLRVVGALGRFDISVKVLGGGVHSQAGAIRHGIARALVVSDPTFRPALKKAGFLTRDPREKERKKYGLLRARKRQQFSKR